MKSLSKILALVIPLTEITTVDGLINNPEVPGGYDAKGPILFARDKARGLIHDHLLETRDDLDRLEHHTITEDHILAIRDAPVHLPIRSTHIKPGELLDHILSLSPNIKPKSSDYMEEYQFHRYSFNASIWNGGIADYLSRPIVKRSFKLDELHPVRGSMVAHSSRQRQRRDHNHAIIPEYNKQNAEPINHQKSGNAGPEAVKGYYRGGESGSIAPADTWTRAECWLKTQKYKIHVWAQLDQLRELASPFCSLFDAHLFLFSLADQHYIHDIREFSLGTIYYVVKAGDNAQTMRANFQFIYGPRAFVDGKFWYPMTIFTGIQGMCHTVLNNFLNFRTMPPDCLGGARVNPDTVGGWAGLNGGDKNGWDKFYIRWAVDPYEPGTGGKEPKPNPYPDDNKDNGLPGSDPVLVP
ncbi:hypothetical protein TWF694_008141 [Orbilia ellipsospora]|uniref:Uncharacterized protein n=1 Tax=Orbilia ellipsospora TaxID=2528407 RepID=A0AAV9XG75_9PEZI